MTNFKIFYRFGIISYKTIANSNKKMEGKPIYQRELLNSNLEIMNKNDIFNMIKDDISIMIDERINKIQNSQDALTFEENIREVLQIEFNWCQSDISREFFYREIKLKNSTHISIIWKNNCGKLLIKNGFELYIRFNENDKSFGIFLQSSDIPYYKIKNSSNEFEKKIFGKNIVFFPSKRI